MDNRFKKISYSIYLDPTQNQSDFYAYKLMQQWSKQQKQFAEDPNAAVQLHNQIHVHKDIYLSGLFLYQLKPELAKAMASALTQETITEQTLVAMLSAHNVLSQPKPEQQPVTELSIDASAQLAQLTELTEKLASVEPQATTTLDVDTLAEQITKQQQPTVEKLNAQVATLESLVDKQQKLIEQLLQAQRNVHTQESSADTSKVVDIGEGVSDRLNKVQKVKKKGIF
ncbi:hypothetical protein [Vibrio sp. WXL103]|uniref:hypothetical protein n=1 Tax=unclassified Vibrio TaxID=2614977 RepID=UPI003EC89218